MKQSLETASPESKLEAQRRAKATRLSTARSNSPRAAVAFSALAGAMWLSEMLANLFRRVPSHRNEESLDAIFVAFEGVVRDALVQSKITPMFDDGIKEEQNGIPGTRY
jgi:hypothetical protein